MMVKITIYSCYSCGFEDLLIFQLSYLACPKPRFSKYVGTFSHVPFCSVSFRIDQNKAVRNSSFSGILFNRIVF